MAEAVGPPPTFSEIKAGLAWLRLKGWKRRSSILSICKWKAAPNRRIQLEGPMNYWVDQYYATKYVLSWKLTSKNVKTFFLNILWVYEEATCTLLIRILNSVITHHGKISSACRIYILHYKFLMVKIITVTIHEKCLKVEASHRQFQIHAVGNKLRSIGHIFLCGCLRYHFRQRYVFLTTWITET